jgi:ABC-2 type transport system permease protein
MTAFLALVRKDLILFLSDRRALLVNLALPIVIASFFGYLFGGSGPAKTSPIPVALVQQDSSATGAAIAAGLKADQTLALEAMSLEEARRQVQKGARKAAIVIPAGFGEAAGAALFGAGPKPSIGLLYDPSQQAVLGMVKGLLTQQVMQVVSAEMVSGGSGQDFTAKSLAAIKARGGLDADSAALVRLLDGVHSYQQRPQAQGAGAAKGGMAVPFATSDEQVVSPNALAGFNGYAHAFAGMSVQFILFLGIDMGIGILLARRSGYWNRVLAAPVTLGTVLGGRAASGALIAFGLLAVIFLFAMAVFGVQISNVPGFIGVALCFALLTASFGLFIAAFGKTPEAARGIAVFATLIMVMLGGAWMPSFLFPEWVQTVSQAVPTRWAIDGLDAMTWRGLGMDAALKSMGVQLAFTAAFGALAVWKFGREQQEQ